MLPPSAVTLLNNRDRSGEQTVITGYATDPPEAATSIPLLPAARAGKPSAIQPACGARLWFQQYDARGVRQVDQAGAFSGADVEYVAGQCRQDVGCQQARRLQAAGAGPADAARTPAAAASGDG
jgi:hypothetical protein